MNTYEIKTQTFAGPIEKLLELIEARQLDITQVSLSEVTADFLNYVRTLSQIDPRSLSDFLVVAARLVLIKSKALLPSLPLSEEDEEDIHDLERRLEIYKQFKKASKNVEMLWGNNKISYGRELFDFSTIKLFYPSDKLTKQSLTEALDRLLTTLNRFTEVHKATITRTIVSLETKMQELVNYFNAEKGTSKFSDMAKNKEEVIVLFLAVLHLIKDRLILVQQNSQFSDIIMKSANRE
ncbi:MAG: segregation/condensation protein A [bacterium]|nr:segregation/condensation protein A [bacterium]